MKKIYFKILIHFLSTVITLPSYNGYSQCPEGAMATDGYYFFCVSTLQKSTVTNNNNYEFVYSLKSNDKNGVYFFRIKNVCSMVHTRFSGLRSIELKSSGLPKFNFYPNPSDGIIGTKFDDIFGGKLSIQVIIMQGQSAENKGILRSGVVNCQIVRLQRGMYGLKLKDVTANYLA